MDLMGSVFDVRKGFTVDAPIRSASRVRVNAGTGSAQAMDLMGSAFGVGMGSACRARGTTGMGSFFLLEANGCAVGVRIGSAHRARVKTMTDSALFMRPMGTLLCFTGALSMSRTSDYREELRPFYESGARHSHFADGLSLSRKSKYVDELSYFTDANGLRRRWADGLGPRNMIYYREGGLSSDYGTSGTRHRNALGHCLARQNDYLNGPKISLR